MLGRIRIVLEALGGVRPWPSSSRLGSLVLGAWWLALLAATLLFVGRATPFIYIDF